MDTKQLYLIAADATLFIHVSFVGFVILGLILVFGSNLLARRYSEEGALF